MGNIPVLKPAEVVALLVKFGFSEVRQRGSHKQFRDATGRSTTVPFHPWRDISPVLLRQIAKDIGLTVTDLLKQRWTTPTPAPKLRQFSSHIPHLISIAHHRRVLIFHIALHFLLPLVVAQLFFKPEWKISSLLMMTTMLVDLDHLLADPIYDPSRCSIGFHPLHTYIPIGIYVVMSFIPFTRLIGIGLVIHMALDATVCL